MLNICFLGFIQKPQVLTSLVVPPVLQANPVPPVVNTCIALTTTSTVTSIATTTPQLSALADVCTTVSKLRRCINPKFLFCFSFEKW
jgi:hypothetical protein